MCKTDLSTNVKKTAWIAIEEHLTNCGHCRMVVARQRTPLAEGGCSAFQQMLEQSLAAKPEAESPVVKLHVSDEMIDEHYFGRLSDFESRLFNKHVNGCSECAIRLHNELLFIYSVKAAFTDPSEYRNRNGASFAASQAA